MLPGGRSLSPPSLIIVAEPQNSLFVFLPLAHHTRSANGCFGSCTNSPCPFSLSPSGHLVFCYTPKWVTIDRARSPSVSSLPPVTYCACDGECQIHELPADFLLSIPCPLQTPAAPPAALHALHSIRNLLPPLQTAAAYATSATLFSHIA